MNKEIKDKKCNCGKSFKPFTTFQKSCSRACEAKRQEEKERAKQERGVTKKKSERLQLFETARIVFNAFIRERDKNQLCICCGRSLGENYEAGHGFSGGGHSNVIFNEDNTHAQRFDCNNDKAGNFVNYLINLEERIGKERLQKLTEEAYKEKKYTTEELKRIISHYKNQLKNLRNGEK